MQSGDIIGVSVKSGEFGKIAWLIEAATKSSISHVGMIDGNYVIEASEHVKKRSLAGFLRDHKEYSIYRYETTKINLVLKEANRIAGRWYEFWKKKTPYNYSLMPYDPGFYCSQLIDHCFRKAGIVLTDEYISVNEFKESVKKIAVLHGLDPDAIIEKIIGSNGYYRMFPKHAALNRKHLISPGAIARACRRIK